MYTVFAKYSEHIYVASCSSMLFCDSNHPIWRVHLFCIYFVRTYCAQQWWPNLVQYKSNWWFVILIHTHGKEQKYNLKALYITSSSSRMLITFLWCWNEEWQNKWHNSPILEFEKLLSFALEDCSRTGHIL